VEEISADMLRRAMTRVARDVLANVHPPADESEDRACTGCPHTAYSHRAGACFSCSCPGWDVVTSTEPVHTITDVPERAHTITDTRGRPRGACTCSGHVHMMGRDNLCGHPLCRCWTPVRARGNQPEHTDVHTSTDAPRACTVCLHGEHAQGKCEMHVYVDGVARPCPCLASRTVRSTHGPGCGHITCEGWSACRDPKPVSTRPGIMCTLCEHAPHGAGNCRYAVANGACLCTGTRTVCSYCNHDHGGAERDCPVTVGKQACPCPYAGGRR
jgi:hypothetical protein